MRKITYLFWISTVLLFSSCEKENFDTNGEDKEVAVIYSLLDLNEPKQFIKINKGFQNIGTNAVEIAKNDVDINQFLDSIIVEVEEINSTGKVQKIIQLQKELISGKKEGVFNSEGNYWYTFDTSNLKLNASFTYKVKVTNTVSGKVSFAETGIISERTIGKFDNLCWRNQFNSCSGDVQNISIISTKGFKDQTIEILTAKYAGIYKVYCELNYYEFINEDITTREDKKFRFSITGGSFEKYTRILNLKLSGESFFNTLNTTIDVSKDDESLRRVIVDMDFTIIAGGTDLAELTKANNAFSSITQTKPFYTNVHDDEGNQGVGIVSTRYFKKVKANFLGNLTGIQTLFPEFKFQ